MSNEYHTLREIVDQLKACEYACIAGKLENNEAFQELERLANEPSFVNINQEALARILADTGSFEIKTEVIATSTIKTIA